MHYMKTILDRYKQRLSNLLREIMNRELCPGLPLAPKDMQGDKVISHVIPCRIDLKSQQHLPVSTKMFSRDERRGVLCMDSNICCMSIVAQKIETKKSNVKPLHPNTPLSNVNPERVIEHTTSIKEFLTPFTLQVQMTKDSNGLLTISCRTLKDGKRV